MPEPAKKTSATEPPDQDYLRVIPMGGLNEVGMNCCIIESNGSMILVDCGLTFPESSGFGVDVIFPDLSYVLENLDFLDGVVLTHGHEDHIGALPFFLREVDVPVYGGKLTLAMLQKKLEEQGLSRDEVTLHEVAPGDRLQIESFIVEFIHVNHSIPNAMAVAIETSLGRIMFTGDWKLDHTPIEEPPTDLQRLAAFGQEGLLALLGDSTNSGTPGFSSSESDVQRNLARVLENAPGRVIVAQFSSNLHRVQGLLELAAEFERVVALQGRSMLTNFGIARALGFVRVPDDVTIIDARDTNDYPDDEVLLISTGSQAEPRAALTRIAYGAYQRFSLKPTDTVVLSARVIPGNEVAIQDMVNRMTKRGARVITPSPEHPIHATGHARREELKLMINLTRPKHLVPVHGSYAMRARHAEIGKALGVEHAVVIEDGDVLEFTARGASVVDRVHVGRIFVDGRNSNGGGDIEDVQLRDRKKLAHSGILVAHAILDLNTGKLTAAPDLMQRGFLNPEAADGMLGEAAEYAAGEVAKLSKELRFNPKQVQETLRVALRRFFSRRIDKKPMIAAIVHTL